MTGSKRQRVDADDSVEAFTIRRSVTEEHSRHMIMVGKRPMPVTMAESDLFPTVVEFMSVASMVVLEATCHGVVAGHVVSPL